MRISYWSADVCSSERLGDAGVGIDVDHADVRAERIGDVRRVVVVDCLEARLHAFRQVVVGRPGNFLHGFVLLRQAPHLEAVDLEVQVVFADLQQVRGDLLRLGADLATDPRSEEHTSELQSLMRISYAVFCLKKKKKHLKHKKQQKR